MAYKIEEELEGEEADAQGVEGGGVHSSSACKGEVPINCCFITNLISQGLSCEPFHQP
jgi:hypothetical protein